jgi:hypothetical protein
LLSRHIRCSSLTSICQFNIFYPDLIDKTKAPSYRVKTDPEDPDTALIIFTAGPPYEDIGFRIGASFACRAARLAP